MRFITLIVLFQSTLSFSQDLDSIRLELERINEQNVELRKQVMPTVKKYGFQSLEMKKLDQKILAFDSLALVYAKKVIERYGWLGKSDIGELANETLFIIIQHAQNPDLRKKYFPILNQSAEQGESDLSSMATMKDRMLIEQGKKQLYGTQSRMVDGELVLYPIVEPESLNERRLSVGLEPLEDF